MQLWLAESTVHLKFKKFKIFKFKIFFNGLSITEDLSASGVSLPELGIGRGYKRTGGGGEAQAPLQGGGKGPDGLPGAKGER